MPVTRRNALKQLVLVSAGTALLPACFRDHSGPLIQTKNYQLDADQQKTLEALTAAIIPGGTPDLSRGGVTPGAREVGAHVFILKMLDDCFSKEDRDKYLQGLQRLDAASRQTTGAAFLKAEPAQREKLLATLDTGKGSDEALNFFYKTTKHLTIQAYTSSQYYLTKVQVYELVPGRWHGCVPAKPQANPAS